ncbi:hypothetical protein M622_13475 [Thauera terpenica 58Eu]|uniref:Uncharacterized protein n=1 Tax=Thauera terpenica 58Eu TaxID=1348657 RepID=T0B083_9RHOO|nr:hypothetical protein M622_13475 [Thauera terpenica 58Eu]
MILIVLQIGVDTKDMVQDDIVNNFAHEPLLRMGRYKEEI